MVTLLRGVLVLAALSLGACASSTHQVVPLGEETPVCVHMENTNQFVSRVLYELKKQAHFATAPCPRVITATVQTIGKASPKQAEEFLAAGYGSTEKPEGFVEEVSGVTAPASFLGALVVGTIYETIKSTSMPEWNYVAVIDITGEGMDERLIAEAPPKSVPWRIVLATSVATKLRGRLSR